MFTGKCSPIFTGIQFGKDLFGCFLILNENMTGTDHLGFEDPVFQFLFKQFVIGQNVFRVIFEIIKRNCTVVSAVQNRLCVAAEIAVFVLFTVGSG